MPFSTVVFLYGLSIVVGVMLVVFGLSLKPRGKEDGSENGMGEPMLLQFTENVPAGDDPMAGVPPEEPWEPPPAECAKPETSKGRWAMFSFILRTPFGIVRRRGSRGIEDKFDVPTASEIHLSPQPLESNPEATEEKSK